MRSKYRRLTISLRLFLVVTTIAVGALSAVGADPSHPVPTNAPQTAYLRAYVNRDNVTTGERLIYEVRLYSPEPNVVGVDRISKPKFERLPHAQTAPDSQMEKVTDPYGREWYSAVIDRFFIEVREDGKHAVKGGTYDVTSQLSAGLGDSFWDVMPTGEIETISLKAQDVKVKSNHIPTKGRPEDFSGAVGDFSIRITTPHGFVKAGDLFPVYISISGEGNLDHAELPDIRSIFPPGLQLISINDERSHYVKDGALGSEMEIECVACAHQAGDYTLAPLKYAYFNSLIHKYVTATSDPITIQAVSALKNDETQSETVDV